MSNERLIFNDLQGLPRKLRNKIDMYPIRMRDAFDFNECVQILNIDKNSIDDANILQMSYLRFLLQISFPEQGKHLRDMLVKLLKLIFRTEYIDFGVKEKREKYIENENGESEIIVEDIFVSLNDVPQACFIDDLKLFVLVNNEVELSEFDFSKIKNIVGEQNMIEMSEDKYQSKEYKDAMARARRLAEKRNGAKAPLSQLILSYQYEMKIDDINKIFDMTLYQFNKSLETIAHVKNSDTLLSAVYSGMVKPKDNKIPHWLNAIEKVEDPLKMDAEEFSSNISNMLEA